MMKSRRLPGSIGIMLNNVLSIVGGGLAHVLTVSCHHPSHLVAIKDFLSVREPNWIFVTEVTPAWTIGGGKAQTPRYSAGRMDAARRHAYVIFVEGSGS